MVKEATIEMWTIRVKQSGRPDAFMVQPDGSYFPTGVAAVKAWWAGQSAFPGCRGELHRVA